MADVRPFSALRYDEAVAGPLDTLVAPPYDVISPEQREELAARSPRNVVRLTLPEREDDAARLLATWREEGAIREEDPAVWALEQEYVGPDGVARLRRGIVGSLRVEPYERGVVLPHERTHAGPKEGRLRLLRATGTQLEPIFLLYDGEPPLAPPAREPDLEAEGVRLWRVEDAGAVQAFFRDRQLLIADGHHRYETALAYHEEQGTPESGQMLVVLVSTGDPGLTIFPTHRVVAAKPLLDGVELEPVPAGIDAALARLAELDHAHPAFAVYEPGSTALARAPGSNELDVAFLDGLGLGERSYTPDAHEAAGRVDRGEAAAAFLLRPTRIEDVFAVARRGEVLPQKTTFFYPKLLSGLLFHPAA